MSVPLVVGVVQFNLFILIADSQVQFVFLTLSIVALPYSDSSLPLVAHISNMMVTF
jgi:hypothetical protein